MDEILVASETILEINSGYLLNKFNLKTKYYANTYCKNEIS